MEWLEKYIFPAEAKTVSPEMVRVGTRLAALEMIQSGTTTFTDMYYFEEEIAKATRAAGLRAVLGQTIIRFPVADAKTPEDELARTEAFIKAFKGDALITPAVAPHSAYTLEKSALLAARDLAREVRRAAGDSPGGDGRRGANPEGAGGADAGRLSRIDRLLGAAHDRGARGVGKRRRHRNSRSGAAWASRTTRKAT